VGTAAPARARRGTALALAGVCGVLGGLYGLLDAGSPALLGLPLLAVGVVACAAALAVGSRRDHRTRYRPDPWAPPEWAVTAAGAVVAASVVLAAAAGAPGLVMPAVPAQVPVLPVLPALAVLVGLLPAVASPVPPQRARLAVRSRTGAGAAAEAGAAVPGTARPRGVA
jgi:energy-coupling factor transport system permease protein